MAFSEPRRKKFKRSADNLDEDLAHLKGVKQVLTNQDNCLVPGTIDNALHIGGQLNGMMDSSPVVVIGQLIGGDEEVVETIESSNEHQDETSMDHTHGGNNVPTSTSHVQNGYLQALNFPTIVCDDKMQITSQNNLHATERKTKPKGIRSQEMQCHVCSAVFSGRSDLLKHQKTIHPNMNSGTVKCKEDNCNFACFRVNQLIEHLTSVHLFDIFEETMEFSDETEFLSWKEDYEMEANCQYRLTSSKGNGKCRYYNCSRSGYYIRKDEKNLSRRSKLKGTSKLNGHCVAGLIVRSIDDGKRHVVHTKTHYGHVLEANHLRVSPSQRSHIRVLAESGLSVDDIVTKVNTMKSAHSSVKVTRKDVVNVVSSFLSKKLNTDFSFTSPYAVWNVSNVALKLKDNIIFHKAKDAYSTDAPNLKLNDFMLCIMTPNQIERLCCRHFSGLGVHLVKNSTSKEGTVIICVYECVPYIGRKTSDFPLAWCVSNGDHEEILQAFFGSIKKKCGDINLKYLVSEYGFNIHSAWCDIFSSNPLNVTAPSSIRETISSALQKYVKSVYLRKALLSTIQVLFSVRKPTDFSLKMHKFIVDCKNCPAYNTFMEEYFKPNFVDKAIPNFAAVHYSEYALEIMVFDEVTSVLRHKMFQACCKPVSRAVSDLLKYGENKERGHAKMQCYTPKAEDSINNVDVQSKSVKSKVHHLKCMVTNLIGMLDDGFLPTDYDEAIRELEQCETLIIQSSVPSPAISPKEAAGDLVKEISKDSQRNSSSNRSNYIRVKKKGFSGRMKLQTTPYVSRRKGATTQTKPASELSHNLVKKNSEEIINEKFVLLEEVVKSE